MAVRERVDFYEKTVGYGVVAFGGGGKDRKTKEGLDKEVEKEVGKLLP